MIDTASVSFGGAIFKKAENEMKKRMFLFKGTAQPKDIFLNKKLRQRKHVTGSVLLGSHNTLSYMRIHSFPSTFWLLKTIMIFLKRTL